MLRKHVKTTLTYQFVFQIVSQERDKSEIIPINFLTFPKRFFALIQINFAKEHDCLPEDVELTGSITKESNSDTSGLLISGLDFKGAMYDYKE